MRPAVPVGRRDRRRQPRGDRLNFVLQDLLPRDRLVPTLRTLLERYRADREGDEGFGDWCTRLGAEALCGMLGVALPKAA